MGRHSAATTDGALDAKTKRLMMVAVTAALRFEPCLREQLKGALQLGDSCEENFGICGIGDPHYRRSYNCLLYAVPNGQTRKSTRR
jgi:hypothetical protein